MDNLKDNESKMDNRLVKVYYCRCGKSIERAAISPIFIGNDAHAREVRKDFKLAKKWGRKIAEITMDEYKRTPFMECDYDQK